MPVDIVADFELALMIFDKALHHAQAQSCAIFFKADKGLDAMIEKIGTKTGA